MESCNLYLDELNEVNFNVCANEKSIWKSYIFNIILGFVGIHWLYLGRKKLAISRICLSILTISLIAAGLFVPANQENLVSLLIAVSISTSILWTIVDLFLIGQVIESINNNNEQTFIGEVLASRKYNK